MSRLRALRHYAGAAWHRLNPSPAEAAWRQMCRDADRVPRRTPGLLRVMDYDLEYVDLLSTCPQWHDIFVHESLKFVATSDRPRILDCGANIGLATLWLRRAYPQSRVTAFEADPNVAVVLQRNLTRNGAADVECVAAAAWTAEGTVSFLSEGSDSGAVADVASNLAAPAVSVSAVRLRDWIAREPIDLLKLDIEGAELPVLRDCENVLANVSAIQMEVHDFSPAARQLPACLDLLTRTGFVTALDDLVPVTWRPQAGVPGPFPKAVPAWLVLVRAWRGRPTA